MIRPLNLLHVTTFYPPYHFGGDGAYVHRLAHAQADEGHHVDVVHCVDAYRVLHPGEPEIEAAGHPGVHVHALRSRLGRLSPLLTQQSGRPLLKRRAIQRLLAARQYDIVHFHNTSLFGPGVLRLDAGQAVKLYTAHEYWLICPTHTLWKYNERVCETPTCLRCTFKARRPPQVWRYTGLIERCCRAVDRFFAPSRFAAAMHRARGFTRPIDVLPNFTARVDERWRERAPRPHARPYCLFVGRLERYKGAAWLARAWHDVADADLLIAGMGAERGALEEMAAVNPRIRLLGGLAQQQLGPYYAHALACVVPTLSDETFGNVVIEAFAHETPVVVSDRGALPEIVEESGGGVVYRTEEALVEIVRQMTADPARCRQLGARGHQAFTERWDTRAHLTRYFHLAGLAARERHGRVPWAPADHES